MHAAVVELDALADAVRAAAEDHDLLLIGRLRSHRPRRSSTCRRCWANSAAQVSTRLKTGRTPRARDARAPQSASCSAAGRGASEKPARFSAAQVARRLSSVLRSSRGWFSALRRSGDLRQEPGIDGRQAMDVVEAHAAARKASPDTRCARDRLRASCVSITSRSVVFSSKPSTPTGLQAAQGLLQRFLEGAADGHHLADRLHLRRQAESAVGNFSKAKRGTLVTT